MTFRKNIFTLLVLILFSCSEKEGGKPMINQSKIIAEKIVDSAKVEKTEKVEVNSFDKKKDVSDDKNVKIDSVTISEIKDLTEKELPSIFDYYHLEKTIDEYEIWSDKLFGRCCSNTDLSFTQNLYFKITSTFQNKKYPASNLSDTRYLTTYAFKKESNVIINLQLDMDNSFLQGKYSNRNLLKPDEIIMNPIRLSLVNGYGKSKQLFYKNGRVKEMEIHVNSEYKQTVTLIDTPSPQEFTIDAIYKTKDVISLVPKTYYSGEEFDDICISEIQTNLGETALLFLNEKFDLMELMNKKD